MGAAYTAIWSMSTQLLIRVELVYKDSLAYMNT